MSALDVSGLVVSRARQRVLHGVDLHLAPGEILTLLGRNGSGRSTLLQAIMGLVPAEGEIRLEGARMGRLPAHERARRGLAYVPETRDIFPTLTVEQNLQLGLQGRRRGATGSPAWTLEGLLERFPVLKQRLRAPAGTLSGGEQQMLTLSRSLLAQPRVLLVDEPTEGLSPNMTSTVQALLQEVANTGCAVLLAEQKLTLALDISERCLVLARGEVVFDGPTAGLGDENSTARDWLGL